MVEIFIEPELAELEQVENAAEWFEIASQLGLEKQISLADKSEEKKAPPYMFIDPKTASIIKTLCPRVVNYKEYKESTIPTDILLEISKCEKNGWYDRIKIAYDDKSPDPFVFGEIGDSSWNSTKHLIGRWGAELLPWEQLEINSINRLRDTALRSLHSVKHQIEYAIQNPDAFIKSLLGGENAPAIDFRVQNLNW